MDEKLKKEKDVIVRITTLVDGESFVTQARGEYARDAGTHYVAYTEFSGNEITRNGLYLTREKLFLHRSGNVTSDMLFDPKSDTRCRYRTMGLEMSFLLHTSRYDVLFCENRLVVDLCYTLTEERGGDAAAYELKIEIADA